MKMPSFSKLFDPQAKDSKPESPKPDKSSTPAQEPPAAPTPGKSWWGTTGVK